MADTEEKPERKYRVQYSTGKIEVVDHETLNRLLTTRKDVFKAEAIKA